MQTTTSWAVLSFCATGAVLAFSCDGERSSLPTEGAGGGAGGASTGSCSPTVLASAVAEPRHLVVDELGVYFTGADGLGRVPLSGGAPELLADVAQVGDAHTLRLDAGELYWTAADMVLALPRTGGSVRTVAGELSVPRELELAADHVYWLETGSPTRLARAPRSGGAVETLATGMTLPAGLALDATAVYWTDLGDGTVNGAPLAGGNTTVLASAVMEPQWLLADGNHLYFASGMTLMRMFKSGGVPTTLGEAGPSAVDNALDGLLLDGTALVWALANAGLVQEMPMAGGAVSTVASDEAGPVAVAVGEQGLYWANADDGTIVGCLR